MRDASVQFCLPQNAAHSAAASSRCAEIAPSLPEIARAQSTVRGRAAVPSCSAWRSASRRTFCVPRCVLSSGSSSLSGGGQSIRRARRGTRHVLCMRKTFLSGVPGRWRIAARCRGFIFGRRRFHVGRLFSVLLFRVLYAVPGKREAKEQSTHHELPGTDLTEWTQKTVSIKSNPEDKEGQRTTEPVRGTIYYNRATQRRA